MACFTPAASRFARRLVHHRHRLPLVVGLIGHVGGQDDLMLIGHRLRVAALVPPLVRDLHDPRLGVGEVDLVLRLGDRLGRRHRRRRLALRLAAGRLLGRLGPRPLLQQGLGLLDLRQPALPPRQLLGQFVTATVGTVGRILGRVGRLRPRPGSWRSPASSRFSSSCIRS